MSLPRDFIEELRTRTSLTHVAGRTVIWDKRKSNPSKGNMWAPCPFHQESSASFHVDDRKGQYYCFGCRAKGDVFSFVREKENVGFIEAVRILALEAGMPIPELSQPSHAQGQRQTQDAASEENMDFIVCECSCGKTSKVPAGEVEPYLGEKLTSANALSLLTKLRCAECGSSPKYVFDDQLNQLFGPAKGSP